VRRFWNVQIEAYEYGAVKAAIVRGREAPAMPRDRYKRDIGREVYSLWFGSEAEAEDAVVEARRLAGEPPKTA
jgi:hypothetical protein